MKNTTETSTTPLSRRNEPRRLQSLDALRGFDMLFIMGGGTLLTSLAVWCPIAPLEAIARQMQHVPWHGLAFEDLIFPLFLFIAGVSFPFSLEKQRLAGRSGGAIALRTVRRALMLVLLGLVYNGLLHFDFEHLRCASVLGRIGIAWMLAALLFQYTTTRTRIATVAAILIGYWMLLALYPAPDGNGDPFSMEGSLVGYVDRLLLPGQLYLGIHDPEGILGTLPATGTALLGMLTGEVVKSRQSGNKKTLLLLAAGILLTLTGWAWDSLLPINKNLWTSSFACVAGGISLLLFALFYYVIDVRNCRKWTFFFRVIGMNSITIYLAQQFISFDYTSRALFGGVVAACPETMQPLTAAAAYIAVCWAFLYFLYRQNIFLKV